MNVIKTKIKDLYIIEPQIFSDNRGWFCEMYSEQKFKQAALYYNFVQDNHSYSVEKHTFRGLHLQVGKHAQAKLVRVLSGSVLDVAVDLRESSKTYKQWVAVELSCTNKKQLLIPRGFAHGFLTLTKEVDFIYKVDNYYNKEADRTIKFDDLELNINWGIDNPILSEKDATAPFLSEVSMLGN